jgi:predicted ATPase/class 3 adenylate cyclase
MDAFSAYIPTDRRYALAQNCSLADRSEGAALFADVSGFTPLTEALARSLGSRRGAEELTLHLNSVYQALIQEVDRYGGSVIAFAGDAITCWFQADDGRRAVTCAQAMQQTMQQFSRIQLADGTTVALAVKVGIACGPTRRFVVGDPQIQVLDVLAGSTLSEMAAAAHLAGRGDIIATRKITQQLGPDALVIGNRKEADTENEFFVLQGCGNPAGAEPWPELPELGEVLTRPWLIRPVFERLRAGQGEFLTELRPAVAIFVKFEGIDYDADPAAGEKLNQYVVWVQREMARYEGFLVDVAVGDKGSYLYCCFGAPIAHENDAWRAVTVAHQISRPPADLPFIRSTQIGISGGTMRTGAYGATSRRTYGVLGDEVNLAARLMERAVPGQVLVSGRLCRAAGEGIEWQELPPIKLKGKADPVGISALVRPAGKSVPRVVEAQYGLELVGRKQELEVVQARLSAALAGQGQVLCFSAEAGLGKSRLVAEALRFARQQGVGCFTGECQSHGMHTSYQPWQHIWQGLFGLEPGQSVAEQIEAVEQRLAHIDPLLTARLPLLAPLLNLPIPDNEMTGPLESRLRKSSLEALLVDSVRFFAQEQPLCVVLEDTHWIDPLSQDLLDLLARSIAQVPVLLLFTERPPEASDGEQGPQQASNHTRLSLTAFTDEEAKRLIGLKLAQLFEFHGPTPPVLAGRLLGRAAGNPFYLEELLNYLKDQQVDFEDAVAVEKLDLPSSLHSLVLSRIDRLTETQQGALKVASVVGRLFQAAVVWGVQGESERTRIAADLRELCQSGLTAQERPEPELTYLFRHVVTQEVTYESLPHATRTKLHTQIARCLENLFADRLEQQLDMLAFHFDRGLDIPKKRQYLQQAGEAAQQKYANAAAVSYFERALPLLEPAEQIGVFLKLGKVRELTGEWKQAGACYQRAFESAEQVSDRPAQARSQAAMGDLLRKQGCFAEAIAWLNISRTAFEQIGDLAGVGQSLHALGTVAAMQGDYVKARSVYEESLQIRRKLDDRAQIASLLSNLGIIARFSAEYDQARTLMEQSLGLRRELGDRWAIANSLNNLGVLLRDIREWQTARKLLEQGLVLNRQVGDRWAIANTLSSLGELAIDQKDWPAAREFLRESLTINQDLGDRTAVAFIVECFATMSAGLSESARALQLAGAASQIRSACGSPLSPAEQQRLDKSLEAARTLLPPQQAKDRYDEGARLALEQAVALALNS